MVMCVPNTVYNSLDVRDTVFFYNYNFVSEMTLGNFVKLALGQVVTLTVEKRVCILGRGIVEIVIQ